MGKVFKVLDYEVGKECALKISKNKYSNEESKRIAKEASIWFKFRKIPQVVEVFEIINIDGKLGILMEWIEYGNVRKLISDDNFNFEDRIVLLHDIISALKECNKSIDGFSHLDIKPENCLITKYKLTKLSDFGIASFNRKNLYTSSMNDYNAGESILLTYKNESINIGTPLYMSPEQILGRCKDGRKSDIYSFGIIGFEILNKSHPIISNDINEILKTHIEGIQKQSLHKDNLPDSLFDILNQCISTDIEKRPAIENILSILENFLSNVNKVRVRETINRLPDHWTDDLRKAYSYWTFRKKNEAIELLRTTLEKDPYNSRAWLILARWIIEINPTPNDYIKVEALRYIHRGLILIETIDKEEKEYWDKFILTCVPARFDITTDKGLDSYNEFLAKINKEERSVVSHFNSSIKASYGNNRCLCVKCGEIKYPIISRCPNCGFFPTDLRDIYNTTLLRLGNLNFDVEGDNFHREATKLRELRKLGKNIKITIKELEEDEEYEESLKSFVGDGGYDFYKSILEDNFDKTKELFHNLVEKRQKIPKEKIEFLKEKEYFVISPPDQPYTAKWGLEAHFCSLFPDEKESDCEYSLLNFENVGYNNILDELIEREITSKLVTTSGTINIYNKESPDAHFDIVSYIIKNNLKINHTELYNQIFNWEQKVKFKAKAEGAAFESQFEIFVKVFIFIKLGYITKYKKLADIFSLPVNLYIQFEKLFDMKKENNK